MPFTLFEDLDLSLFVCLFVPFPHHKHPISKIKRIIDRQFWLCVISEKLGNNRRPIRFVQMRDLLSIMIG